MYYTKHSFECKYGGIFLVTKNRTLIATILLVTAFVMLLNQTVMITALPVISKDFHLSLNVAQWLTSGYVLMLGLATPISANLIDKYTSRQVFIGVVTVFLVGTILGPMTSNFYVLLLARLLQAVAGGIMITYVQISLIALYPADRRGTIMGLISLVVSAGPAVGPSFSGLMLEFFSWKSLFYVIMPIIVIVLIIAIFMLPNFSKSRKVVIDIKSVTSSMVGLGSVLASISLFSSDFMLAVVMLVAGSLITWYFVHRQGKLETPLLNMSVFKKHSFTTMLIVTMLVFGIMMGTEAILPIFFEDTRGMSSLSAGLILLPGAIASALTSPIIGRYYDSHGARLPIYLGSLIVLVASISLVMMTTTTSVWVTILAYMLRMIGISMIMSVAITEGLKDLKADEISHGTTLNNALRQISGSAFNAIMVLIATIPSNLVVGTHLAIWMSILCTGLLLLVSRAYLN
ncbi:multidrug transporter [Secundilactobacillus paracollinoides]|uniref:Multidrug transporter n=1 Tax=Secundilactobacillus paracollinoides TaxID=240427 RepID=A0A1B2IWJ1_9LACO|nr:multidrug transporter [Secundilactobacillus paracollinoides]